MSLLLLAGLLFSASSPVDAAMSPACPPPDSYINIGSGVYSPQKGVSFRLRGFRATAIPQGRTAPACYQRTMLVSHAEIFASSESITAIFGGKLDKVHTNIHDLRVQHTPQGAVLTGVIEKLVPIHFSIAGPVSTDGRRISLNATSIKADGIPIKALLGMVGEQLNSLLQLKGVDGIQVEGNTLSFSPEKVAHLRGVIRSVSTSSEGLTLRYGTAARPH